MSQAAENELLGVQRIQDPMNEGRMQHFAVQLLEASPCCTTVVLSPLISLTFAL